MMNKKAMAMKTLVTWLYILLGAVVVFFLIKSLGGDSSNVLDILENVLS